MVIIYGRRGQPQYQAACCPSQPSYIAASIFHCSPSVVWFSSFATSPSNVGAGSFGTLFVVWLAAEVFQRHRFVICSWRFFVGSLDVCDVHQQEFF